MKLLVPTAGPEPAKERADYILNIAKTFNASLEVLHIAEEGEDQTTGKEALKIFKDAGSKHDVQVATHLKEGNVVKIISEFAESENVDLIVMGASEGRIVAQWIVTDVIEKSKIPVVIIPYGFSQIEV
ncbi:MAG: universal stress protein [Thermoplasmata archaeon]|nr:MAG: universal stress protein [Thermoplasmata archaeon]